MKKTLTINLNNSVFHIDDDAYELLQSYLAEVSHHFKSESEKADIMNDIEARIAELFNEKMDHQKNVITIDDVDSIITIMGKPSQFVDEDETEKDSQTESQKKTAEEESFKNKKTKKYYRDIDNRLLGGVASGLAAYFNWDTALMRIIFVLLAFLTSGTFILIYLLMWIIIPKAETTAQKLEMHGEEVNIETIKNKMVDAKEYLESDNFKTSASEVGSRIWDVIKVLLKIFVTLIGAIVSIIGVILIAGLIFGLIVFLLEPDAITGLNPEFFSIFNTDSPDKIILLIISLLLIIGAPIFALIYWSLNTISKNKQPKSHSGLWIALILWLAGIFMFLGTGADTIKKLQDTKTNIVIRDNANQKEESRTVANFHAINASGAIELELTQQSDQTLSISTLGDFLPNVKTEVKDSVLKIYATENLIRPKVKVKIGIPNLTNLEANGASKVNFNNTFNVKNLNISLQGASKTVLKVNSAQKLVINLEGASKLNAEGTADSLIVVGNGASKIEAENLQTKFTKINLGGAGNAEVFATDEFDGKANEASQITVHGNPAKRKDESHSGSAIKFE